MRASGAVAASSLSALNLLAANPPRYPYNPTDEPREPLTLYISRVPGTRDVILSTLKPQRKNVTSEDVAHALYYVHLDLPTDELLATHPQPSPLITTSNAVPHPPSLSSATATSTVRAPVSRKPVPGSPLTVSQAEPILTPIDNSVTGTPISTAKTTATAPIAPPHVWLPPPRRPVSPPHISQPWVPPGYHLDENHSFEKLPSDHHSLLPTTIPPLLQDRQPAGQDATIGVDSQIASSEKPPVLHAPITRKPVGPQITAQDKVQTQPPVVLISAPKAAPPCLPATTALPDQPPSAQPSYSHQQPPESTTCEDSKKFVPFQLTLIRRDPSSEHQWNIGKIASVQPVEQSTGTSQKPVSPTTSAHSQDTQTDQPSISVHLETSGYAKFRGDDEVGRGGVFARQVVMAYTRSWTAGIRNAFKRPSSQSHERSTSDSGADVDKLYRGFRASGNKDFEPNSLHLSQPQNGSLLPGKENHNAHRRWSKELLSEYRNDETGLLTRPGPGLKLKGYTFTSPWEGRCEFRTGNGGRSLTCRHILHPSTDAMTGATGGGVAGYNPLVIAQSIRDGQNLAAVASAATGSDSRGGGRVRAQSLSSALSGAAKVSELRFNLPHGEVFRTKPGGSVDENKSVSARAELYGRFQDHLQQLQSRHRQSLSSTEYVDELDDNDEDLEIDLALGRENAGGGARGKRAKLGKLIVYDDGFKMLDLVVAANLGVWWVSWERNF
ncbi:hypothetical protein SEPCBS57363_002273 [Sporothrix epigloea]|uniref:Oxidoreductase-like protein n=1 Tax=Sporothrix epigloea TaxID=1892477 RepID=A0ABP0DEX4_9PEZI